MPLLKFVNNDLSIPTEPTPDIVGFGDSVSSIVEYNSVTLIDIVGFKELSPQDNSDLEWEMLYWESYSTDFVEWISEVYYLRTRLLTITENLIEHLGLSEILLNNHIRPTTETYGWDRLKQFDDTYIWDT